MLMKISELIYAGYRLTYFCSEYAILSMLGNPDKIILSDSTEIEGVAVL